jgi:hypothetical protein
VDFPLGRFFLLPERGIVRQKSDARTDHLVETVHRNEHCRRLASLICTQ